MDDPRYGPWPVACLCAVAERRASGLKGPPTRDFVPPRSFVGGPFRPDAFR
ncbi:hypothetical protein [Lysobacter gummosus]|uniref:hypothetical protein n=1 Tax=Lysobacter gummosus TaxID=262324 RepID=UPI00363E70C4